MNAPKAKRVSIAKKGDLIKKGRSRMDIEISALAILCASLQLPESMTYEDYVNIGSNIQTDERLTETQIQIKLQSVPMGDLEEEVAEEANTI